MDEGGPKREFFSLLYNAMGLSSMFQMLPNERGLTLNHDIPSLATGKYLLLITVFILHLYACMVTEYP